MSRAGLCESTLRFATFCLFAVLPDDFTHLNYHLPTLQLLQGLGPSAIKKSPSTLPNSAAPAAAIVKHPKVI